MITARFPVAHCDACARDVALYSDVVDDALVRKCLHCDSVIQQPGAESATLRLVHDAELRKLGYVFDGDDPQTEPEGCGKPNCGKGECKTAGKKHPFSEQA